MTSLKLVKGTSLFHKEGKISIRHYDTDIFKYDINTKKAWMLLNCSVTSNKMVKRAIDFFNIDESNLKVEHAPKWSYSS